MGDRLWRFVEARLQRALPASHATSAIGDLAEDYAIRRTSTGRLRSALWLVREASSLMSANRTTAAMEPERRRLVLATDLRYAVRRLRARLGPALACAGLLALGIGLCTAAFSAVDAVLLQPAPFGDADRLVRQIVGYSEPDLMEAWRTSGFFDAVEAGRLARFPVRLGAGSVSWSGAEVTPGVFELLGVSPIRGRTFAAAAGHVPADEIIISEGIWQTVFGGDPAILGTRLHLDAGSAVVVGIMPAAFRFPAPTTEAWKPLVPIEGERGESVFNLFGRLRQGVAREAIEGWLKTLAQALARLPRNYIGPGLHPLAAQELGHLTGRSLWLLLGGAGLVFVLLCANVSGLVLASLSARRQEFATCTALGASRARLIREAVFEHTIIGIAGASAGVWIAFGLTSAVPAVFQGHTLNLIDIDYRALGMASLLGIAAVIASGVVPAWLGTRPAPLGAIRTSRQAGTDTRGARFASNVVLITEVALACALLIGSALLLRSFVNLAQADRGLRADGVVRISVAGLDVIGYGDAMKAATDAIAARFAAWPPIAEIALSRELPPAAAAQTFGVHLGSAGERPDPARTIESDRYRVSPSFFDLYGVQIVRGRAFREGDPPEAVVISERLAARLWPGQDALGRTLAVGSLRRPSRVVGVAREIEFPTIDPLLDLPEYYTPLGAEARTLFVNIRCRGACPNENDLRAQVQAIHPELRARIASPAGDRFLEQLRLPRATAQIAGVFAAVAVFTSACGLFSVLTYAVGRRRREFGIRAALGASPAQIHRLVVGNGMTVVATGVGLGAFAGWLVARSLASFFYGVTETDAVTWALVLGTVTVTSLTAAWRPARQAARTNPVHLLLDDHA